MKKTIALLLAFFVTALLLTGCGKTGGEADAGTDAGNRETVLDTLKTIGDVIALSGDTRQISTYDEDVVYAFEVDGTYFRARAKISGDARDAFREIDYSDPDHEEKENEILAPLPIDEIENLSEELLTGEEMKALVGKTGQDLLNDGWTCDGYNLDKMEFWMEYGPFLYTVVFNEKIAEADYDSFRDEDIGDLTVRSVTFLTLGDATAIY